MNVGQKRKRYCEARGYAEEKNNAPGNLDKSQFKALIKLEGELAEHWTQCVVNEFVEPALIFRRLGCL